MSAKPKFRPVLAERVKVGSYVLAPAVMRAFMVHKITTLFDGTLYISLDVLNDRHLRCKPEKIVWVAV